MALKKSTQIERKGVRKCLRGRESVCVFETETEREGERERERKSSFVRWI